MNNEDKIEHKINQRIDEIHEKIEGISKSIEGKSEEELAKSARHRGRRDHDSAFWGIALVAVGGVWLGRSLGWFDFDLPILPTALIVIGLYILLSGNRD